MIFVPVESSKHGVFSNKNYRIVSCCNGRIELSYASKGPHAMTIHFASNKAGLRHVRSAIDEFCNMLYLSYNDLKYIYGAVAKSKKGIMRMITKIDFKYLIDDSMHCIYVRAKK